LWVKHKITRGREEELYGGVSVAFFFFSFFHGGTPQTPSSPSARCNPFSYQGHIIIIIIIPFNVLSESETMLDGSGFKTLALLAILYKKEGSLFILKGIEGLALVILTVYGSMKSLKLYGYNIRLSILYYIILLTNQRRHTIRQYTAVYCSTGILLATLSGTEWRLRRKLRSRQG
jgi:hypothetical protein